VSVVLDVTIQNVVLLTVIMQNVVAPLDEIYGTRGSEWQKLI